jgi:Zn-dependent peptidase ImmA (M78 family)
VTRVEVSSEVLEWAVKRTSTLIELEHKFPKLPEWIKGESQPTLRQLEAFAKATATPLGFFFLSEPPEEKLPIPFYRTTKNRDFEPTPNLIATVQAMEQRQLWMSEYLANEGQEPLPFVGSVNITDPSARVAKKIREAVRLEKGWASLVSSWTEALKTLQEKIEELGILLAVNGIVGSNTHRKLDVNEFRGFVLIDKYAPLIFVNGADSKAAQMFTLAHELAHVWFGISAAFDLHELQPASDGAEKACDKVAAEFLVPEDELRDFWITVKDDDSRFQKIAAHFKVSELVAGRRSLDLGLINHSAFHDFYVTYIASIKQEYKSNGGGDFYATVKYRIGRRFGLAVARAAKEGELLYRDAYRLTGLHGATFEKFVAETLGYGEMH